MKRGFYDDSGEAMAAIHGHLDMWYGEEYDVLRESLIDLIQARDYEIGIALREAGHGDAADLVADLGF